MRHRWLAPSLSFVILVVAFHSSSIQQLANGLQSSEHEQSSAGAGPSSAALQPGGPMMSLSSDSSSALESAGVMNAEDLIAAESSQSPESASEQQHKAFTSAQIIRQVSE